MTRGEAMALRPRCDSVRDSTPWIQSRPAPLSVSRSGHRLDFDRRVWDSGWTEEADAVAGEHGIWHGQCQALSDN